MHIRSLVIALLLFSFPVLSHAQKKTKSKGEGRLVMRVDEAIDSILKHAAHGVVVGAADGLKDSHLQMFLDSVIAEAGKAAAKDVGLIRDTLLSDKTIQRLDVLRDSVLGKGLARDLKQLVDTALGQNMVMKTKTLVRSAIDEALSAKTKSEVAGLVDSVGKAGGRQIGIIVDSLLAKLHGQIGAFTNTYNEELKATQEQVKKWTTYAGILLGLVVLVLSLLAYVYYEKRKIKKSTDVLSARKTDLEKLAGILTYQIHETRDDAAFNDLKMRISNHAKREGLEPMLRDLLQSKGMLGDSTRQSVTGR